MTMTPFTNNQPRIPLTQVERNTAYDSINLDDNVTSESEQKLIDDMKLFDATTKPATGDEDHVASNVFELTEEDIKTYASTYNLKAEDLREIIDDKKQEKRNDVSALIKDIDVLDPYFDISNGPKIEQLKKYITNNDDNLHNDIIASDDVDSFIKNWGFSDNTSNNIKKILKIPPQ